ncbi:uncharacterized protein L969DRAFT_43874 [Mixia osmundae IAM 14324]|uniref:Peptidase A1 domain-containing protein n=1 Tax=Mixia osmundae (strain CBS 9802 / IAM 14324 / JCM 22182 / KY 12970) TaxID=764103 RepID=G7DTE6_MIXOS|nr:uncharacterized protein L969DRAFT_43874 [Mixia osmundae IAM 14324]KEI42869.1 hypothetical protein L969DRAFT_43874 [Mixia osmundae IAM 14324]GAA93793.1 hypothetical protein E5Q_00439 [Mixia osmundae IAM 14324]
MSYFDASPSKTERRPVHTSAGQGFALGPDSGKSPLHSPTHERLDSHEVLARWEESRALVYGRDTPSGMSRGRSQDSLFSIVSLSPLPTPSGIKSIDDEVLLPYAERQAEVAELLALPQHRLCLDTLRASLTTDTRSSLEQLLAMTRDELPDRAWSIRLASLLCEQRQWPQLALILGIDRHAQTSPHMSDKRAMSRSRSRSDGSVREVRAVVCSPRSGKIELSSRSPRSRAVSLGEGERQEAELEIASHDPAPVITPDELGLHRRALSTGPMPPISENADDDVLANSMLGLLQPSQHAISNPPLLAGLVAQNHACHQSSCAGAERVYSRHLGSSSYQYRCNMKTVGFAFVAATLLNGITAAPTLERRTPKVFTSTLVQDALSNVSLSDLIVTDRSRHEQLFGRIKLDKRATPSKQVTNAQSSYYISLGLGSPATTYPKMIIDTGSSNTFFIGYKTSSTTVNTGETVSVNYGSGSYSGREYMDSVNLASGLTVTKQGVSSATRSTGFTGVNGIMGVGPVDLTQGTTSRGEQIPTVIDTAYTEGFIPARILSLYFAPTTAQTSANGEATFGGVDTSKTTTAIRYTPVTSVTPAAYYWGVTTTIATTKGVTIEGTTSGIVDSGTTLVYLSSTGFSNYQAQIPGAAIDSTSGLLRFPKSSTASVPALNINFGNGLVLTLTANAQLVPAADYAYFGLSTAYSYSYVNNYGSTGTGLDFILGQKFIERYYTVFDTTNHRIGFANTTYTLQ